MSVDSEVAPWFLTYEEWLKKRALERRELIVKTLQRERHVAVISLAAIGVLGFAIGHVNGQYVIAWTFAFFVVVAFGSYFLSEANNLMQAERWAMFSDMYEVLPKGKSWYVAVSFLDGECVTGSDSGVLWIDDLRIYFTGKRTSFVLTRDDVSDQAGLRQRKMRTIPGIHHERNLILNDHGMFGQRMVSLHFGPECRDFTTLASNDLTEAIDMCLWLGDRGRHGQLPPTELGPGALTPDRFWVVVAKEVFRIGVRAGGWFFGMIFIESWSWVGSTRFAVVWALVPALTDLVITMRNRGTARFIRVYRQMNIARKRRLSGLR